MDTRCIVHPPLTRRPARRRRRPGPLASGLALSAALAVAAGALPQSSVPTTIMVEPGEAIRPEQARAPAFLLDKDDQLIVIDQVRGFMIGRFRPPVGLAPESAAFPGGVGLESESAEGPPLPLVPITPIALLPGFPFLAGGAIAGSPCVLDIDRDGRGEIIAATVEGAVYVIDSSGHTKPGWPQRIDDGFYAAPSAADLNGDGRAEIVLPGVSGWLYAWRADGSMLPGWPVRPTLPNAREGEISFFGAAALADLNGDQLADVCVCTSLGTVWAIRGDGRVLPGWPRSMPPAAQPPNPAGVFSSPAIGDLDGDGRPEVIVANNAYQVHAWRADGEPLAGWPVDLPHRARAGFTGVSLGDVDGDDRLEVVVVTEHGYRGPASVLVFAADGTLQDGWPYDLTETCNAPAAIGDLTGDGVLEIVVATIGGHARLVALDGATAAPLPGWPLRIRQETVNASPVIADIDGDGWNDILFAALSTGTESDAWIWALDAQGNQLDGFPIMLPQDEIVAAAPSCGDLNGDGTLELIVATERINNLYAWDLDAVCDPSLCQWPGLAGGPARTGIGQPLPGLTDPLFGNSSLSEIFGPDAVPGGQLIGGSSIDPQARGSGHPDGYPEGMHARVAFGLDAETAVSLVIYNIRHEPVRRLLQHRLPAGRYDIHWDGRNDQGRRQSTGIYFYELDLGGRRRTEQLLLLQ